MNSDRVKVLVWRLREWADQAPKKAMGDDMREAAQALELLANADRPSDLATMAAHQRRRDGDKKYPISDEG